MKASKTRLLRFVLPILRSHGIEWSDLVSSSKEIILFGSTVLGKGFDGSDVDLLCVGNGKRIKTRTLDLMWRSPARIGTKSWLGSELANHIASYGVWLHGRGEWVRDVFPSRTSVAYKRKLIAARARCLFADWSVIRVEYRQKHVVKLRRDLQRLLLLQTRKPVPPTPLLDATWARKYGREAMVKLVRATGTDRLVTKRRLDQFSPYLKCRSESDAGRHVFSED